MALNSFGQEGDPNGGFEGVRLAIAAHPGDGEKQGQAEAGFDLDGAFEGYPAVGARLLKVEHLLC